MQLPTNKNSPNSVGADFVCTFASFPDIVDKTAPAAPIADDYEGILSDDNGGATGDINKMVDEVMFNVMLDFFYKSYNYVNKVILQYFFSGQ